MNKEQARFLAEKITQEIFIDGATRIALKKKKVDREEDLGGWGKEPFTKIVENAICEVALNRQAEGDR